MILYAAEGMQDIDIAARLDCSPYSVWGGDERGSAPSAWMAWRIKRGRVARAVFPPQEVAEVKAACELPRSHDLPLSRFSQAELHRLVVERGITEASASTIWRWLHEDVIKPWQGALVDLPPRSRLR